MFGWSAFERLRNRHQAAPVPRPSRCRRYGICARKAASTVKIKSADPLAAPETIRFNFLASEYDFQALIYGTRFSRKIVEQSALKPFVVEEVIPGLQCHRATTR